MSDFILVAETGSDIPEYLAKQHHIYTVPMHVAFGDETRDDGSFPIEDIYNFFERTGTLTKTSGCTVGDFEVLFDALQKKFPNKYILHLAYSAVTTCSYQSALIAADGRKSITSIDTKHVSAGQSMVILMLARYLEAQPDTTPEQAIKKVHQLRKACRMAFFPGDLAYLRAGGRVSNAAYLGAKILSLNPLIEIQDGYLKATKKYRGKMEKLAPLLLRDFTESNHLSREILSFVYSKGLKDSIRQDVDNLAKSMDFREILWIPTGGVVTTHCGPGGFGVCGFARE